MSDSELVNRCRKEQLRCATLLIQEPNHPQRQLIELGLADWMCEELLETELWKPQQKK